MSATLPLIQPCCLPTCDDPLTINIPGPPGEDGADGTNGEDGIDAFTALTVAFTMPAEGDSDDATVGETGWMTVGQIVFVETLGYMEVMAIVDSTTVTLLNVENTAAAEYATNAAGGTVAPIAAKIGPGGIQGPDGVISGTAVGSPSDLKGTYPAPLLSRANSKGMMIVGNGTDAKDFAVGTNGQIISADSTQTLGVKWSKALPITGDADVADNRILRFNTATGLPVPLQSSYVEITDTGAIRAVGSGGNARGTDANDFQVNRDNVAQVASGDRSVITGGEKNTVVATEGFIGGGNKNTVGAGAHGAIVGGNQNQTGANDDAFVGAGLMNIANGNAAAICGGNGNAASGTSSFVGAGGGNTASGAGAAVVAGTNNVASAAYSSVPGGFEAVANKHGQAARSSGKFSVAGDNQCCEMMVRNATANATPTELYLDGASLRMTVPTNTSWTFEIMLVARTSAGLDAIYKAEGVIRNNAGTTTINGVTVTQVYADPTLVATAVGVTADNTNDALVITVTGIGATNIRWVANVRVVELTY